MRLFKIKPLILTALIIAILSLHPCTVMAQTVAVTGTITDTQTTPYSNGLLTVTFVNSTGQQATFGGNPSFQKSYAIYLDANGAFTISLPPNSTASPSIQPAGTQWNFSYQSQGGYGAANINVTITGAGSISGTLSNLARITWPYGNIPPPGAAGQGIVFVSSTTLGWGNTSSFPGCTSPGSGAITCTGVVTAGSFVPPGGAFGPNYSVGGGTAQAQTVAPTTAITNATLVDGYVLIWSPLAPNSGPAPTLAGSGSSTFSAHPIVKYGGVALIANDIITTTDAVVIYNLATTSFILQNPQAGLLARTSYQAVGAAAQAMNLYVSGGCDGISACTGFFWGLQAPVSLAASLQYTPPIVDGLAGDGLTTDGSQHMAWAIQRRTLTGTAYTNATTGFTTVVGSAGQTLQFTVAASSNYKIACDIEWQGSANTTGPKWQWTGPASPTALVQYAHNPVTTSTYLDAVGSKTAFSSPMADTGTITAATDFVSHLDLELVNGVNAGTVVLQAAANGAGTLTIQPGSSCVSNGDK